MADFTTPAEVDARIASALQTHTYTQEEIDRIKTAAFLGGATTSTVFNTSLGPQIWRATQTGTYTNGLVVDLTQGVTDMVYDGTTWTKSVTPVSSTPFPAWTATSYLIGAKVKHLKRFWFANVATASTDIPGTSTKWSEDITAYADKYNKIDFERFEAGIGTVNLIGWRNGVPASTYTISDGVVTLATRPSDDNLNYRDDTPNKLRYGEELYLSAVTTVPSVLTSAQILVFVLGFDNGGGVVTVQKTVASSELNAGEYNLNGTVPLTSAFIGSGYVPTSVFSFYRLEIRLRIAGATVRLPRIVNKSQLNYLTPFVRGVAQENYTPAEKEKLGGIQTKDVLFNISTHDPVKYAPVGITEDSSGFPPNIRFTSSAAGLKYFDFTLDSPWIYNHKYFVAFEVNVVDFDMGVDGNLFPFMQPKFNTATAVGSAVVKSSVVQGDTGSIKAEITITSNAQPTAAKLLFQFGSQVAGQAMDVIFTNVIVSDLGETGSEDSITYGQASSYFDQYGYVKSLSAITSPVLSESGTTDPEVVPDLEGWGDSLMAQNWMQYIPNRNTFVNGFGGKASYYIRDQYLAGVNTDRSQIICVGRNNFQETTFVVDDIKTMVKKLPHNRFLILPPPNAGIANELKTAGSLYHYFTELTEKLSKAFPNNFCDTRKGIIELYDFGAVKLTASYVQPAIGSTVQITVGTAHTGTPDQVAGTTFLSAQNATDAAAFPAYANKITIGTLAAYDVYDVVSVDSDVLMTVRLVTNGSAFTPGSTVANPVLETSIKYLKVTQYQDLHYYLEDAPQSKLRSDGIHMSTFGQRLLASIVDRAIQNIGL